MDVCVCVLSCRLNDMILSSEAHDETNYLCAPVPIMQIHGSVASNGPLVFTREAYRQLLYANSAYRSFLMTVMSTCTILFLGFSFSDPYVNELRSEMNCMFGVDQASAYAIANDMKPHEVDFFQRHDGR